MRHNTTKTLFDYFNRIRDGEAAPLRAKINPADLKNTLPDVFILELGRDRAIRFRLAGTRVCTIMGRELRGENFLGLFSDLNRHKMKLGAEAVLAGLTPLRINVKTIARDEADGDLEMLLLPLYSKPGISDRLLGSLADLSVPPLLSERHRELWAAEMQFVAEVPTHPRNAPETGDLSGAMSHVSSFRSRITHLKVLQGGRKD